MNPNLDLNRIAEFYPNAYIGWYPGKSEPGYDDKPTILADWNNTPDKLFNLLERSGYECDWLDEWVACSNCNKLMRTSPNSYYWLPAYHATDDGDIYCLDCMDASDYYAELHNRHRKAATLLVADKYPPSEYGYTLIESGYENGWYPGQNANPATILKELREKDPQGVFIFVMDGRGQFDVEFSVYRKDTETEDATEDD